MVVVVIRKYCSACYAAATCLPALLTLLDTTLSKLRPSTAFFGSARFHAKRLKESVAKYTSFFEQRVAFAGKIFTNICHGVSFLTFVIYCI